MILLHARVSDFIHSSEAAPEARLAHCYSELEYTPYLLPLQRVADTQQQSRILHIVVLVAQDADATWLHHQTEREGKVIAQPSLGERSGSMTMRNQDNILGFAVVHMRCLDLADLLNQFVEARRQFSWRPGTASVVAQEALVALCIVLLSAFTAVSPDVPFLVLVETAFLAQSPDIFGDAAFIVARNMYQQLLYSLDECEEYYSPIVPLSQILRHLIAFRLTRK